MSRLLKLLVIPFLFLFHSGAMATNITVYDGIGYYGCDALTGLAFKYSSRFNPLM
jgi:hypothetical protein